MRIGTGALAGRGMVGLRREAIAVLASVFGLSLLAAPSLGQEKSSPSAENLKKRIKAATSPQDKAQKPTQRSKVTRNRTARPVVKRGGCGDKGNGFTAADLTPSQTGPHPVFTCENTTVKLDPVWRGRPVECNFEIQNTGQADLKLKIKKG